MENFVDNNESDFAKKLAVLKARVEAKKAGTVLENGNVPPLEEPVEETPSSVKKVASSKRKKDASAQGKEVEFPDPQPWPEPVGAKALLDELVITFNRFAILKATAAYHSRNPLAGKIYLGDVEKNWDVVVARVATARSASSH